MSAAIDDVLLTRFQELRDVADQLTNTTSNSEVMFSKDVVYRCFSLFSRDERIAHGNEYPSSCDRAVLMHLQDALRTQNMYVHVVDGGINGSNPRMTWQRPVYATAFKKFFDPVVELVATADTHQNCPVCSAKRAAAARSLTVWSVATTIQRHR
jgi:hypothetical protein